MDSERLVEEEIAADLLAEEYEGAGQASTEEERAILRGRARVLREEAREKRRQAREAVERTQALELEIQQLKQGLATRNRIEHVVGMLMLLLSCDADAAFKTLVHVSSMTNRKVRDLADTIAEHVAAGRGLPEDLRVTLADVLGPSRGSGRSQNR